MEHPGAELRRLLARSTTCRPPGQFLREVFCHRRAAAAGRPVDEIYAATYRRLLGKNRRYFERYPGDQPRAREIVDYWLRMTYDCRAAGSSPRGDSSSWAWRSG